MAELIELTIIIVNWNTGGLLRECIESIWRHPPRVGYEVIVVDNASTDESLALLREAVSQRSEGAGRIRLIENDLNLGFAKANNQAIAVSDAPLLLLLNPDTRVEPGAIDALLASIRSQSRMGACAPRLLNADGTLQPNVWPVPPTVSYILCDGLRLYHLLPKRVRANWLLGAHWDHATRRQVAAFWGTAMMVRREMIEDVGALDESFEMYGEDCEWCVRMGQRGWLLYFEPAAEIIHYGGRSAAKRWTEDELWLLKAETNIRFQQRVLPPFKFVLNQLAYAFVLSLMSAKCVVRQKPANSLMEAVGLHLGYARRELGKLFSGARNGQAHQGKAE